MPLPKGLHGAAAKKVVTMLIERGFLEDVDADIRKGDPLWRETGDGHGTTLVVTKVGLAAIEVEPVVVKTMAQVRKAPKTPKTPAAPKNPRTVTKQAKLITMLEAPDGASIAEIVAATDWQAHYADVRIMPNRTGKPLCGAVIVAMGGDRCDGRGIIRGPRGRRAVCRPVGSVRVLSLSELFCPARVA
jgi:hypothetical protein